MSHLDFLARATKSPLVGTLKVPGDKSISHRAVMLASLAEGRSRVSGFLMGEDTLATLRVFGQMGVEHEFSGDKLLIDGVGLHGLKQARAPLDMENSGTGMRLLAGIMAGQTFASEITGDASLRKRPMRRIAAPLAEMGANIETGERGVPPLNIKPATKGLRGIAYQLPVASAQVKSAVLLAGLYASGRTQVEEPELTRDHTERMLQAFSWPVAVNENRASLEGQGRLIATDIEVPADISSAAFLMIAASIVPGSELLLRGVGVNVRRDGILTMLDMMGADITRENERLVGGEAVADLRIRAAKLRGIDVPQQCIASAIDEFPVLFVAAACASGTTRLRNATELRVKESDRLAVMAKGLGAMGCKLTEYEDGIDIIGGDLGPANVDSQGDHRCAMAFAVAGLRATGQIRVRDVENVATSYPGFVEQMNAVGAAIAVLPGEEGTGR